ncbi:MAG: ABC transporter ATP-binding protein, partial [Candidatus Bathyarchaeia archaeon]
MKGSRWSAGTTYLRVLQHVRPYWRWVGIGIASMVSASLLSLLIPWITGFILIDAVIGDNKLELLPWVVFGLIGIVASRGVATYFHGYILGVVGQKTIYNLRNEAYDQLQRLSLKFFDSNQTGQVQSRVVNDVNTLEEVIDSSSDMGFYVIMLSSTFIFLIFLNAPLTLLVALTFPVIFVAAYYLRRAVRQSAMIVQQTLAAISARTQEAISGIRVIKGFATEDYEARRFALEARKNMTANIRATKLYSAYSPILELATILGTVIVVVYATPQIVSGSFTIGQLVAFLGYLAFLYNPIRGLSMLNYLVHKGSAAAERIFEIMDMSEEVVEPRDAIDIASIKGDVTFKDVSFGYAPGKLVVKNLNLEIKAGERVALVGPSGVGKSTVISLIPRFYDPFADGSVLIDGNDLRKLKIKPMRSQIGLVLQETFLFSGTVRENIAYGKLDANAEEIVEAAKAANIHDFILSLSDGYDTEIGERGVKISMGQRQRIAIARALLKNPRILIMDEATSNLDSESEVLIQEALERLMRGRTTFIIAHRLSTLREADKIVVLENGQISEVG